MANAKAPAAPKAPPVPKVAAGVLIFTAKHTFWLGELLVRVGDSVSAGHPMLKGHEELFEAFQPTHGSVDWGDA